MPVNPSYSGGRDQEDLMVQSQPRQIVGENLSPKSPSQKRSASGKAQGVGPEFKPQYHKKKKTLRVPIY
jgi:hypothetical protein